MPKFAHKDVLDGGLNALAAATKMLLIKNYAANDSYATVTGAKVCEVAMASGDFSITGADGAARTLTTAAKPSAGPASASSMQYDNGTATGGSTTTLTDSSKSWTTNAQAGRAITIISGTGAGQVGVIASNTATVVTIGTAWAVAPDGTSVYRISDNLHIAFTDGSAKVLYVTDETSNQPITSGNPVNFPSLAYASNQPS